MKILFFDIETDNLLRDLTTIHCAGLLTGSLEEVMGLDATTGYDLLFNMMEKADLVVGHNIIGFDLPALGKLFGYSLDVSKVVDTLVLSRLVYPEMKDFDFSTQSDPVKYGLHALPPKYYGKHSLESWGFRLGNYKDDFGKDFTTYTPRMMEYCKQDVRVTKQLYYHLVKELYKWPSVKPTDKITDIPAVWLEMRVAEICQVQEANGFAIDVAKTQALYDDLKAKRDDLLVELQKVHPGWKVDMKTPESYAFDIGEVTFKDKSKAKVVDSAYKYAKEQGMKLTKKFIGDNLTVGPLRSKITTFNPKSHDHIAKLFMEKYDWKPTVFNEKDGKPTVNTSILQSLPYPECPLLIEFEVLQDRCEKLAEGKDGGYIKHAERDGRIHGGIITNGAVTSRATHMRPNLAQVPATGTPYGEEFRSLFIPRAGFKLVGSDADALELRAFSHYLKLFDGGKYVEAVNEGKKENGTDIHSMNQRAAGLDSRDAAKTMIYACVTMDTKTLCRTKGWVGFDELEVGDIILTYNSKDKVKEWKPVLEKVYYEDAPIRQLNNGVFKIKCTPNHRWFVSRRVAPGKKSRYYVDEVRTVEELNSECNIIVNAPYRCHDSFYQPGFYTKYCTDWVLQTCFMNKPQVMAFTNGMLLADGWHSKSVLGKDRWLFTQNINNLSEAFLTGTYLSSDRVISVHLAKGHKNPMIQAIVNQKTWVTCQKSVFSIEETPNEPVWCVRTENESWVIRQNNVITITGNTLYGAGYKKIMESLNVPEQKAKKLVRDFKKGIKGYWDLVNLVESQLERSGNTLKGLDGRKLFIRRNYAALNTLIQSAGAIICKRWMVEIWRMLKEAGLDSSVYQVAWIHDELQFEVLEKDVDTVKKICEDAMELVTYIYNVNCPLKANADSGDSWADTH